MEGKEGKGKDRTGERRERKGRDFCPLAKKFFAGAP